MPCTHLMLNDKEDGSAAAHSAKRKIKRKDIIDSKGDV